MVFNEPQLIELSKLIQIKFVLYGSDSFWLLITEHPRLYKLEWIFDHSLKADPSHPHGRLRHRKALGFMTDNKNGLEGKEAL